MYGIPLVERVIILGVSIYPVWKEKKEEMLETGGRRVFFVFILFFTFMFLSSPALYAAKVIQLDQPKIRLIIPTGQSKTGRIEIKNPSNEPQEIKIYFEDWVYTDSSGAKKFMPAGTTELSCANWVSFTPTSVTIPALGKGYINYRANVPGEAKGGYQAVLFFEQEISKPAEKSEAMVVVPIAIRVGALFYIEVAGTVVRSVQLEKLSLKRESPDRPLLINLSLKNTGNADIIAGGNFNIIDRQGNVYARGEFSEKVYMLPQDTAELSATWKEAIPKGKYDLILTLDLGKALEELGLGRGPVITKEGEIEIGENGEVIRVGELK